MRVPSTGDRYTLFATRAELLHLPLIAICALSRKRENKIQGGAATSLLEKKKKNNMEKKVGAELENGTICLHLSHNYWDCSNFRDAKIPLKANKSSLKSELIFPRGLHASPWKTLRDAHLKVREGDALNIQFPNISSSCLDNYVGLLAQVFVLGILNAGWHLLWTVMLLEIFDLPVCGGSVCSLQCNSTLSW